MQHCSECVVCFDKKCGGVFVFVFYENEPCLQKCVLAIERKKNNSVMLPFVSDFYDHHIISDKVLLFADKCQCSSKRVDSELNVFGCISADLLLS